MISSKIPKTLHIKQSQNQHFSSVPNSTSRRFELFFKHFSKDLLFSHIRRVLCARVLGILKILDQSEIKIMNIPAMPYHAMLFMNLPFGLQKNEYHHHYEDEDILVRNKQFFLCKVK